MREWGQFSILLLDDEVMLSHHTELCRPLPGLWIAGVARNGAEAIRLTKTAAIAKPVDRAALVDLIAREQALRVSAPRAGSGA
jgi:hypothetical protein